jgi:hypothetical protein
MQLACALIPEKSEEVRHRYQKLLKKRIDEQVWRDRGWGGIERETAREGNCRPQDVDLGYRQWLYSRHGSDQIGSDKIRVGENTAKINHTTSGRTLTSLS